MGTVEQVADPNAIKKFRDQLKSQLYFNENLDDRVLLDKLEKALKAKLENSVEGFQKANKDFELFR